MEGEIDYWECWNQFIPVGDVMASPFTSDGYSDTASRPLVNIIVMSPSCPYFLGSVDASREERLLNGSLIKFQKQLRL